MIASMTTGAAVVDAMSNVLSNSAFTLLLLLLLLLRAVDDVEDVGFLGRDEGMLKKKKVKRTLLVQKRRGRLRKRSPIEYSPLLKLKRKIRLKVNLKRPLLLRRKTIWKP